MYQHKMWEVLVPSGYPFHHHKAWDAKVAKIAGGLTVFHAVKGHWISRNGGEFKEKMIPVRVICTREQLEQIVRITMEHYSQQAVLAYLISDEAYIYESTRR